MTAEVFAVTHLLAPHASPRHLAEARFAAVVASSDAAIVTTDPDWVVETWNPAAERLFGYAAEEMVGRSILALVPQDHRDDALRLVDRVRDGERVPPYETARLRRDGTTIPVSVTLWPARDSDGAFVALAAIYTDLTERKRLEGRLRQAEKLEAVGRLAGGIAHDFNNLLTVITGFGDLALATLPDGHPSRGMVEEVVRAGDRAAGLTRQLLAFSRKAVVAPRVLDPNALVVDLDRMLRRLLGEDVDLACRLQPGVGVVRVDPGQLEQVVVNLCVNARDAMPTGGKLTVETRDVDLGAGYAAAHPGVAPGRYVQLAVSDTGAGIPADALPHIFEPFFTTKGPGRGTGLGLATVHGIVQQAGGHVEVYSEVGVGTTFKVYLPRAEASPEARRSRLAPPPRGTEAVLVVEDQAEVRAVTAAVLRQAGYAVLEAADADRAEQAAAAHPGPVHLLVTDVVMPGASGRELAGRLTAARPGLRVLYVSGYTDDAVVRHGVLSAEVAFLQKPFHPAVFLHKVREVLDAPPG